MPKVVNFSELWKPEACGQTELTVEWLHFRRESSKSLFCNLQIKGHCWCTKWCGWEPDKNWKTLHLPEWRTFWWPQRLHQILQMRSWNACDWVLPGNSFLEPRWDSFFFKFEFKALHFYAVRRKPWTLSQTKYVLCSTTLLLQVSIPTVEIKSHK